LRRRFTEILALSLSGAFALCPTGGAAAAAPAGTEPARDIRILIDISGSMKWNDPYNMRVPALRLVANLMPPHSKAGVWTFERHVKRLVPHGLADRAWKDRAAEAAGEIHAYGLYTDIEAALMAASRDWRSVDGPAQRSVILLTDGTVDVSADPAQNARSRTRILKELLPHLQQAGIAVYAIALAGDADDVLLQQLALATHGWFERAETAASLERIFLRMFEQATQPDTLPLTDNKVQVDDSIEEMSLLVFRGDDTRDTTIAPPQTATFGRDDAPDNVRWQSEQDYDLITIDRPARGTWTVNADFDVDNRVMAVTDLHAIGTALPADIASDDDLTFLVQLTHAGRTMEKQDFAHFVRVESHLTVDTRESWDTLLLDNGRDGDAAAGDGIYTLRLHDTLHAGHHVLTIKIDGGTFQRVLKRTFNVVTSPVITEFMTGAPPGDTPALYVIPRPDLIEPVSMQVTASISGRHKAVPWHGVPRTASGEWRLALETPPPDEERRVEIAIRGTRPDGRPIEATVGPLKFGQLPPGTRVPETDPAVVATPVGEEPAAAAKPVPPETLMEAPAPAVEEPAPESLSWFTVAWQILALNLAIAAGIFLAYRKWCATRQGHYPWEDLAHE